MQVRDWGGKDAAKDARKRRFCGPEHYMAHCEAKRFCTDPHGTGCTAPAPCGNQAGVQCRACKKK